jgi:hypothetical protein
MHNVLADLSAAITMGLIGVVIGGCVGALVGLLRWAAKKPPQK